VTGHAWTARGLELTELIQAPTLGDVSRITKPVVERRQEIVDAARVLFLERGFTQTQMSDISERLGVSQGLVYHYFASKTDLLYSVLDALADEQFRGVQEMMAASRGTALELLGKLFDNRPDPAKFGRLFPSVAGDAAIARYCSDKLTTATVPLATELIERGNSDESWQCPYPPDAARFLIGGVQRVMESVDNHLIEDKREAIREFVLRVLGVPRE
jgi:AcrR family transcriptional regulator